MATDIFGDEVTRALREMQAAARVQGTKTVPVAGQPREVPYPFPSPGDWRDCWIYFLMIDRFNNPDASPNSTRATPPLAWDRIYGYRQGGTFKGVQAQLAYIEALGPRAIWLSPVLKNPKPADWEYNYHGYATQDFLAVDERFASDGTRATAERELAELVEEAHARGLHVILDIVLNHAARVFDYLYGGGVVPVFDDQAVLDAPLGQEPPIRWLNGYGQPRSDWQDTLPPASTLSPDDAVWPVDLQRKEFFRRRGKKRTDTAPPGGFVRGDFESMRQLVVEYDAQPPGQEGLRERYGRWPVLSVLVRAYQYLIARYDIDGFRLDTVKYVAPEAVETFGNAIREFALSVGKQNFFTFGEIADRDEATIARFVGRNSTQIEGFGIDAALDFPLFYSLTAAAKGRDGVERIREVFAARKQAEQELLSSHGEAGRYFVSFLDNHDQHERFNHPDTPPQQVTLGLAALFSLQGIPCLYYGTEQGLNGTKDASGRPQLGSPESVREALWGREGAFAANQPLYRTIQVLAGLRRDEPALRYGRLYFREVSGNGQDFGQSRGVGGVLAFSRILGDREVLVVANTNHDQPFAGFVVVDSDLSRQARAMRVAYSNLDTAGTGTVQLLPQARFHKDDGSISAAPTAALLVILAPMEIQVLVPS
jgi:glycosidase